VVNDRVKEREALFASFVCMDEDYSMRIEFGEFKSLFDIVYKGRLLEEKVKELFELLDGIKGYITLDEFFDLIDNIENNKNLTKIAASNNKAWTIVRDIINKFTRFDKISKSPKFEFLMMIIVLFNSVILIMYIFEEDQDTLDLLDSIDNILVWIYVGEVVIKIIGLGIIAYFSDGWNVMDFLLTAVSVATNIALSTIRFARTAKSARLLKSIRA